MNLFRSRMIFFDEMPYIGPNEPEPEPGYRVIRRIFIVLDLLMQAFVVYVIWHFVVKYW